ncbi:MAG: glutamate--tRNA ligase [Bacteroidales bacterium]|nr:glutamate--tRNA ligase [Bacteroidales bacterium]
MKRTRVRFAPSPTGPLHMGGVRTALYNYLIAKKAGGDFILRIEDTDSHRFVPGAEEYIIESLRWCGIMPDEGLDENGKLAETPDERNPHAPYRQSQRKGIYRKYAEQLVAGGYAYYAFDTAEELEKQRAEAEASGQTFIYNALTRKSLRNSLTLEASEVEKLLAERSDWTVRFRMPDNDVVAMDDLIRGHIEVNTSTLDDKVLWKRADELPTYHLANIVDDHLMEISHVIRGEEWLPSLPLHYLLYAAFGWERPQFAHLPLLLKPVGNGKLSKRDGDKMGFPVFPLRWVAPTGEVSRGYREDGYFPDAFVNLLAMLGWNPGTEQEIFSMPELIEAFSLDKVGKSGAKFNPDKAKWFNKEYLRMRSDEELTGLFMPILKDHGVEADADMVREVVALIKERATFVSDFWDISWYIFKAPEEYAEKDAAKFWKGENVEMAREALSATASAEEMEGYIRQKEWPMGKVMNCIRLALTGSSSGLGIADIMRFVGREEVLRRFRRAEERLFI